MTRPFAALLRILDAARTAGTLSRTVRILARQLDNAHLLAASEGARADRAEAELSVIDDMLAECGIERRSPDETTRFRVGRLIGDANAEEEKAELRIDELEAALADWREASGELAAEQPAADPLPDLTDAGEAPIPLVLTDSAREADFQRDRANALFASLRAAEVELVETRAERDHAARAAGAHLKTIEDLREELADALRDAAEMKELARRSIFTQEQPLVCRSCGGTCEEDRRCYARPTCHRCLPPPPALEVLQIPGVLAAADDPPATKPSERPAKESSR